MGRPVSTHCLRGHEIAVVGRYERNGECLKCRRERYAEASRQWRRLNGKVVIEPFRCPTLPFAPLEYLLLDAGLHLNDFMSGTQVRRYRKWGIPVLTADSICVTRLHLHPFEVYGDAFYDCEETSA